MKFLSFFALIIYCFTSFAQQNFEGNIRYALTTENDTTKNKFLKISLKEDRLLIVSDGIKDKPLHTIYDFKKGERYDISKTDSVAIVNKLTASPFTKQKIAEINNDNLFQLGVHVASKVSFEIPAGLDRNFELIETWFSPAMIFKVPSAFRFMIPPFVFFNDSSISLNVKIVLRGLPDHSYGRQTNFIEATSVEEKALSDSIFEIPSYFKIMTQQEYINILMMKFKQVDAELLNKISEKHKEQ